MSRDMSRRRLLAAAGSVALGTALVGKVEAATYEGQPDHVTLAGPDSAGELLRQYRPRLVLDGVDSPPDALYSWRATSAEYRRDWHVYFAFYSYQEGIESGSTTSRDEHFPDREPVYVATDPDTGEIELVVYDRYHYIAGETTDPLLDDSGHPVLNVIPPWHPYEPADTVDGQLVELADLNSRYETWRELGWSVDPESVVNPPRVTERGHWWTDDDYSVIALQQLTETWLSLNESLPLDVSLPGRST